MDTDDKTWPGALPESLLQEGTDAVSEAVAAARAKHAGQAARPSKPTPAPAPGAPAPGAATTGKPAPGAPGASTPGPSAPGVSPSGSAARPPRPSLAAALGRAPAKPGAGIALPRPGAPAPGAVNTPAAAAGAARKPIEPAARTPRPGPAAPHHPAAISASSVSGVIGGTGAGTGAAPRTPVTPAPGVAAAATHAGASASALHSPAPASRKAPAILTPPAPIDSLLGMTIAERYYIEKKLGEGGMGSVYLARHVTLGKQVALKVLHGEYIRKPELVERFFLEAQATSRIRHENIIDITDFGTTPEGVVFFAMEVLEGRDLHDELVRTRLAGEVIAWERSRKILLQICSALAAAHECGVIHRDLKPENVYLIHRLGHHDFVKILDFGIAKLTETADGERKLTRTGMLFGTPEYMAPEQARGEKVDHRVDIYAAGCLLYQLIAGRVPFEGDNFMGVLNLHQTAEPPPIPPEAFASTGAPPAVTEVLARALAKDREARFASMEEMGAALAAIDGGSQIALEPVALRGDAERRRQSAAMSTADTAAAAAALVAQPTPAPARHTPVPAGSEPAFVASLSSQTLAPGARPTLAPPEALAAGEAGEPAADASAPRLVVGPQRARAAVWLGAGFALAMATGVAAFVFKDQLVELKDRVLGAPAVVPIAALDAGLAAEPEIDPEEIIDIPARVTLFLSSKPEGARITDSEGKEIGQTPLSFEVPGALEPRRFRFHLDGHYDKLVELIPTEDLKHEITLLARPAAAPPQPEVEPEVEVVPQERARRSHSRRERARRDKETRANTNAGKAPDNTSGSAPGSTPGAGESSQTPVGNGQPGQAVPGSEQPGSPTGTSPLASDPGSNPDTHDDSTAEPAQPGAAESSDAGQGTQAKSRTGKSRERRPGAGKGSDPEQPKPDKPEDPEQPKPEDPGPGDEPVLKNPFAE